MDPAGAGKATAAAAVCVTGAGGFIASWLVERLLAGGGYAVHGTVRDPSCPKNDHLGALDGASERLRLFKADVPDYSSVESAVAGCAGVFHVASPCPAAKSTNPEVELLVPAVAGTLNVLRACREAGVRRVVVVSSVGAVFINLNPPEGPTMHHGRALLVGRRVLQGHRELVLPLQDAGRARGLGLRRDDRARRGDRVPAAGVRASAAAHGDGVDAMDDRVRNMVDVRDVADALVLAYESPEAAGRYICSADARKVSEMVSVIRSLHPNLNCAKKFVQLVGDEKVFSTEKLQRLGWKFRTMQETLKDSVESYMSAGMLG